MNNKQISLGVLVIAVGVAVLLSNINVGPMRSVLAGWWPVFVILLGALMWWSNPKAYIWPLVVVTIGGLLLINTTGVGDVNLGAVFWPVVLVGFGISLITKASRKQSRVIETTDENISAILGGTSSKNSSNDYTGGTISAIMGGVELDLRDVKIKKEAVLAVSVIMGGVELFVPSDVIVKNRATALMGGLEDKSQPKHDKGPVLYIDGTIIMGGVEIKR